ncbi:MAG: helix-turn-helix domain-containing protein [Coriobacteriales bacterium]|jgi:transcriptional regulator with XRE-family HTH domain|nr:helix-turn-helix transcriptional regulator [Coriobacteriaceae bacterium]
MNYRRVVAANIKQRRKALGLTQEALAQEAGISSQHLSKIERCACSPTMDTMVRIALSLDTTPAALFEDPDAR